jgi:hypothetical protein
MQTKKASRGQALILIVFALVGMIAMVGLAVDSGNAFADRRNAQSAADNAALAGALQKVQTDPTGWIDNATNMAASNGYSDNGVTSVDVYVMDDPNIQGCGGSLPVMDPPEEYILVTIHSTVDLMFGPIIGIQQAHNCVIAIAHAKPPRETSLFYGNTLAAAACSGKDTVLASGSADVTTLDGGVFSNSSDPEALYVHKDGNLKTPSDYGVSAIGGVSVPSDYPSPSTSLGLEAQIPCPLPDDMLPDYTCTYTISNIPYAGMVTDADGYKLIPPGIYCITGNFSKDNYRGTNVTFVMLNNGIDWNGNANLELQAPSVGSTADLLIYLPPTNNSTIKLNGTFDMKVAGSVLAPSSHCVWIGDLGTSAMQSQWICATFDLSGNIRATVQFNDSRAYKYPSPPNVELSH